MPPLAEGQVGRVSQPDTITFTQLTSCISVLVRLEGGDTAGAHLALMPIDDPTSMSSEDVMPALVALIDGTKITHVTITGHVDVWSPAYLNKSPYKRNGDPNYTAEEQAKHQAGMVLMSAAILGKLGFHDKANTVLNRLG